MSFGFDLKGYAKIGQNWSNRLDQETMAMAELLDVAADTCFFFLAMLDCGTHHKRLMP